MLNLNNVKETTQNRILSDKINIKEVMNALHVADIRTAIKWCKKKNILILKFGKETYVNMIDFDLAIDRPFIESLRLKHPGNWKEIYSAHKNGDYLSIIEQSFQEETIKEVKYVAPGKSGNDFIKNITKRTK